MRFSNNSNDLFKNIDRLPEVLVDVIYSYVPKYVTIFLSKNNYIKDHCLIRKLINKRNTEQYIRAMIRQDNDFVFKQLLVENYNRWLNMKKYYYKECIYANYLFFLESYAIEYESTKCRQILNNVLEEEGLSKNQHKKKRFRYIRWKS